MEKTVLDGVVRLEGGFIQFIPFNRENDSYLCFKECSEMVYNKINSLSDYMSEFDKWHESKLREEHLFSENWLKHHGIITSK